jgi:hypothetical protein
MLMRELTQRRLQLTTNEVSRLRLERTRLMDIGNQLRAALHKVPLKGSVYFAGYHLLTA